MDDVLERMREFQRALDVFDELLTASMRELEQHHDAVAPLWQDELRRAYDARWEPLHERLREYAKREGPAYEEFLLRKTRSLEGYLYGD
ncbi:MAG: hypothetical protein H6837_16730 [Planctomycetes bacterium]|nr:hypothetical protein [Planctomycetota bacterium]